MRELDIEKDVFKRGISALPPWHGMSSLLEYYNMAEKTPYPEDSRSVFCLLFETGCRRAEAVKIKREQIAYNDEAIIIRRVPVLKKSLAQDQLRDVWIRRDNVDPLADELVKIVEQRDSGYMLPRLTPFSRSPDWNHSASPRTIYNRVHEIHPDLFPHALRSFRASFLVWERGFDLRELVQWFKWESQAGIEMALHYTSQVDMARKLGIRNVPV